MAFQIPSQDVYAKAMMDQLPPGKAWPRDTDTNLYRLVYAIAGQMRETDIKAYNLIAAAFPSTATAFLPEWEKLYSLPDKCTNQQSSDDDIRAQVVVRFTWTGESTISWLKEFCTNLGYVVEVKEWGGAICGASRAGKQGCQSSDRSTESALTINIINGKNPSLLKCELQAVKPYYDLYIFNNGQPI